MKETICISCKRYLNHQDTQCLSCQSLDEKAIARVYNIVLQWILKIILERLSPSIEDYKQQINDNDDKEKSGDIPFRYSYQKLLKQYREKNLVSLLLHLDGIGLIRSTQLKLWLFSGLIVELPPKLRNRRYNMIPLSIWVGYSEPEPEIWLKPIVNQLMHMKTQGVCQLRKTPKNGRYVSHFSFLLNA